MSRTYDAATVDGLFHDLYQQVESALVVAESAFKQSGIDKAALEALKAEHGVVLQKVASTQGLNPGLIESVLDTLQDLALLEPRGREKVASELAADPNAALRLLDRVLTISAGAQDPGAGVPKSASTRNTTADDPDGWNDVIRNGA